MEGLWSIGELVQHRLAPVAIIHAVHVGLICWSLYVLPVGRVVLEGGAGRVVEETFAICAPTRQRCFAPAGSNSARSGPSIAGTLAQASCNMWRNPSFEPLFPGTDSRLGTPKSGLQGLPGPGNRSESQLPTAPASRTVFPRIAWKLTGDTEDRLWAPSLGEPTVHSEGSAAEPQALRAGAGTRQTPEP